VGQAALTVVADAQPYGLDVARHEDVDAGRVPCHHLVYVLPPILMVVGSLVSCVGETWVYYLLGSLVEVVLLAAVARSAWRWPAT